MRDNLLRSGITNTTEATVLSSQRITPIGSDEVRQIILRVDDPAFDTPQGLNLGVLAPGPHPFGNKIHHRYYSIARAAKSQDGAAEIELLVRRCFYIDEVSGEQYPGAASNFLCYAEFGDQITLTGPYQSPFAVPIDKESNLLMLGTGTGIAPFRAFLRRVYEEQKGWKGKVRLYYGARTGADLLYMNDLNNDLANYFDKATFEAIQAVKNSLLGDDSDALKEGMAGHAEGILKLAQEAKTHVYLAGMKKIADAFDAVMAKTAGSMETWQVLKDRMQAEGRWSELTYL